MKINFIGRVGWTLTILFLASVFILPQQSIQRINQIGYVVNEFVLPLPCNNTLLDEEYNYLANKTCLKYHRNDFTYACFTSSKKHRGVETINPNFRHIIFINIFDQKRDVVAHELFHGYQDLCTNLTKKDVLLIEGTAELYAKTRDPELTPTGIFKYDWINDGYLSDHKCYRRKDWKSCLNIAAAWRQNLLDEIIEEQNITLEWLEYRGVTASKEEN